MYICIYIYKFIYIYIYREREREREREGGHFLLEVLEILEYTLILIFAFFLLENILEFKYVSLGT